MKAAPLFRNNDYKNAASQLSTNWRQNSRLFNQTVRFCHSAGPLRSDWVRKQSPLCTLSLLPTNMLTLDGLNLSTRLKGTRNERNEKESAWRAKLPAAFDFNRRIMDDGLMTQPLEWWRQETSVQPSELGSNKVQMLSLYFIWLFWCRYFLFTISEKKHVYDFCV